MPAETEDGVEAEVEGSAGLTTANMSKVLDGPFAQLRLSGLI